MTNISIPYTPRPLQAELHSALDDYRWAVVICHRRFGKTVMAINHLLRHAVLCKQPNPRVAYIGPTFRQAKMVAFDYCKQFAADIPGVKFHETELRVDLPNSSRIQLLGAENPDSLRGIYLDYAVLDEMAMMPENLFPEIVRPALSDRKGKALFIGTPQGHNAFYDLYERAVGDKAWYTKVYRASEPGVVDAEELEAAASMMTQDQYQQEFECSWVANVPGSIYGKEMQAALDDDRIGDCPYDPSLQVDTWWDLGIGDSTAIIFTQQTRGGSIRVIDCYEARNEGLPHYVELLRSRGYLYGTHNGPHDLEVRELGTGKSRREIAYDLGLTFRVVPKLGLEDGIHAAQLLLPRCIFDADACKPLLEALRQYHRAYNQKTRAFRLSPIHDWSSHYSDAFRYLAVGLREMRADRTPPQAFADNTYSPLAATTQDQHALQ